MNQNGNKKFTDQFYNPNGSYHIPTWLIIVGFIINGALGIVLLIARFCEDKTMTFESPYAECGDYSENPKQEYRQYCESNSSTAHSEVKAKKNRNSTDIKKKINTDKLWLVFGIAALIAAVTSLPSSIQELV